MINSQFSTPFETEMKRGKNRQKLKSVIINETKKKPSRTNNEAFN